MFFQNDGISAVHFFYETIGGISVVEISAYIIYYVVILTILILSLWAGKRGFCHYICWISPFMIIGTKIKHIFNWPSLRLKAYSDLCIRCKRCNQVCPMSLDVMGMVQKNKLYNSECILCGLCVDHCPKKSTLSLIYE